MSLKRRLRTLACCGMLELGALFGMPMRPEQIQQFMQALNESKVTHVLPSEDESGDPPSGSDASVPARDTKHRRANRERRAANREARCELE